MLSHKSDSHHQISREKLKHNEDILTSDAVNDKPVRFSRKAMEVVEILFKKCVFDKYIQLK